MKSVLTGTVITTVLATGVAQAQQLYIGEIFMMSGSYCPVGTIPADGRMLSLSDRNNYGLAAVIGATYGGDMKKEFAIPNLQGAISVDGKTVPVSFCIVRDGIYPSRS